MVTATILLLKKKWFDYKLDEKRYPMPYVSSDGPDQLAHLCRLGPVVQSVVSLTSSLRVISLTVFS